MSAILREDGIEAPVDLADLDDDIRWGRVAPSAELRHAPWTGDFFQRLDEIPQLAEALAAPAARFAANLRARRFPFLALALSVVVMSCAALQSLTQHLDPALAARVQSAGWVGWDASFLDGRWWGGLTANFLHWDRAPLLHALANLPFLAYCGFRVEQAWGRMGLLRVLAGAAAGGAIAVMLGSDRPVVGSSMLAYGLIGAQISIGFRMGEAVPSGWKGIYGWGNLIAFLMIFGLNKGIAMVLTGDVGPSTGVSHLGHLGGLVGGGLAVLVGAPAVIHRRPLRDLVVTGVTLLAPVSMALVMPLFPTALGVPWQDVTDEYTNVSVRLPGPLAAHRVSFAGLAGWRADPNSEEPLLIDRMTYASLEARDRFDWTLWWSDRLNTTLHPTKAPEPLREGWTADAWSGDGVKVVEYRLEQGVSVVRVAWMLYDGLPDLGARERLYLFIADTVDPGEPPDLVDEREKYANNPTYPKRIYNYTWELIRAGQYAEADALLVDLLQRTDGWQWEAARLRLRLLSDVPEAGEALSADWLMPFLEEAPAIDMAVHRPGILWLAQRGDCEHASDHLARIREEADAWIQANPDRAQDIDVLEESLAEAAEGLAGACTAPSR